MCIRDRTWSPTIINIEEYPEVDNLQAFSEIINFSSILKSPDLIKSKAMIEVIIFVIDAGYIDLSGSFSYKISPERKSCRIAVLANTSKLALEGVKINK